MIDPVVSVALVGGRGRCQSPSHRWNDSSASSFAERRKGENWSEDAASSGDFYKQTKRIIQYELMEQLFHLLSS